MIGVLSQAFNIGKWAKSILNEEPAGSSGIYPHFGFGGIAKLLNPKSILITGAATGLGAALARVYADNGVHLFLSDINEVKLEAVCESCKLRGADVRIRKLDVTDKNEMERWVQTADAISPLELVIANAGISHGNLPHEETADQVREVFDVNINGMLNTVLPALPLLRKRKRGQIGMLASLACFQGLPHSPSYSASKAAIRIYAQGVHARVKREGVTVTAIIPAFVKTPMTSGNLFEMPWMLEAGEAAFIIRRKLSQGKSEFVFPLPYAILSRVMECLPTSVKAMITKLR